MTVEVRTRRPQDDDYLRRSLIELMAGTEVAGHGELIDAMPLDGLVAWIGDEPVGHLTFRVAGADWEVVTIGATRPGEGVGGALMAALLARATEAGAGRVWLSPPTTTPPLCGSISGAVSIWCAWTGTP